jgi:hypothetical protein
MVFAGKHSFERPITCHAHYFESIRFVASECDFVAGFDPPDLTEADADFQCFATKLD